jgi:hypothetical protein
MRVTFIRAEETPRRASQSRCGWRDGIPISALAGRRKPVFGPAAMRAEQMCAKHVGSFALYFRPSSLRAPPIRARCAVDYSIEFLYREDCFTGQTQYNG